MITDTPETDALLAGYSGYPHPMEGIDLARKLEREKDHLREAILSLYNEVNCRVQHGAESNGHLPYVEECLKEILYPVVAPPALEEGV